jgi:dTDP-L-rhamnose 4-epimerase
MRTLVTGGAGFIGSHLVRALVELGDEVVVLDSLEQQVHGDCVPTIPDGVRFLHGDVGDAELADEALDGVDRIVHLAAAVGVGQSMYEIADYVRKNTHATAVFLERVIARPVRPRRLVVASSMSIYGEGEYVCALHGNVAPPPRSEAQLARRAWECLCPQCGRELSPVATREQKPLIPTSVYAVTKRDHEELTLVVGAAYGIPATALRFFNVYGPGQALSNPYTGVAAIFSSRLLNARAPLVFEDGLQTRDLIHVSDIVGGILLALSSDKAVGRAVNLGTGRRTSVLDVARALADGLDVSIEPEVNERYRAGDIRHCYADTSLAEELLGFRARVSLEQGMSELISWLADQEADDRVAAATGELAAWGLTR